MHDLISPVHKLIEARFDIVRPHAKNGGSSGPSFFDSCKGKCLPDLFIGLERLFQQTSLNGVLDLYPGAYVAFFLTCSYSGI